MKHFSKRILLAVAGVALLLAAVIAVSHWSGKHSLQRWMNQMRGKGERFTFDELALPKPTRTNYSFQRLTQAVSQLRAGPVSPGSILSMELLAWGHARVAWRTSDLPLSPRGTNTWEQFAAQFDRSADLLEEIRDALRDPPHDLGGDYQDLLSDPAGSIGQMRTAESWLRGAALVELHRRDLEAALTNLQARIALATLHDEEWRLIAQIIRVAFAEGAAQMTWQALQGTGWNDAQLARLQQEWERVKLLEKLECTFEVERATALLYFNQARKSGPVQLRSMLGGRGMGLSWTNVLAVSFNDHVYRPLWQTALSQQDELFYLETIQPYAEAIRASVTNKSWKAAEVIVGAVSTKLEAELGKSYNQIRYQFTENMILSWGRTLEKFMRGETMKQMTLTALALKRHQLKYGTLPPNLQSLVPQFLVDTPRDYMDGQSLRYRPNADGTFMLYSVGIDGKDDGGDPTPISPQKRLLTFWYGRDAIWPSPAN